MPKRTSSYTLSLWKRLRDDPKEQWYYLISALRDSPKMFFIALCNVYKARTLKGHI